MRLPARLSKRLPGAHKGDFGHVLVLAGSRRYIGAASLCALAALKSGAGLVTLGFPQSLYAVFAKKLTEVMLLPLPETRAQSLSMKGFRTIIKFLAKVDCLLIGPGLSRHARTLELVRRVAPCCLAPLVIDADGLNAFVAHSSLFKKIKSPAILTPHPGEMARLLGVRVEVVQRARKEVAKKFSHDYNKTLVLKGHRTVVASGRNVYVNRSGNPGMATAGAGDVLAGIIAALAAQGLSCFEAAKYGVYVHGLAGDLAARDKSEVSLIASDIMEYLPKAFKKCLRY